MSQETEKLFYSVTDAAQALDLSPAQVRRMCQRGEIKAMRMGGTIWRIPRAELYRLAGEDGRRQQDRAVIESLRRGLRQVRQEIDQMLGL